MTEASETTRRDGADGVEPRPARARRSDRHRPRRQRRAESRAEPSGPGRGRRSEARRRRRRRALVRTVIVILLLAGIAAAIVIGASGLVDQARDLVAPDPEADHADLPGQLQPTMAMVTYDEAAPGEGARHITILALDRAQQEGTVLFVPPSTVTDVPGHGSFGVGEALAFGDDALVGVTLENLLGIRIDEVVGVGQRDWAELLDRLEGFEIDVPSRLVATDEAGIEELRFEPGRQVLDGPRLAEYLLLREEGELELDVLPRVAQVLRGMLDALAEDEERARRALADGAPMLGAGDPELVRDLLLGLADARAHDRVDVLTLPVSPLGADRGDRYRVDAGRLAQLVDDRLAPSRPTGETGVGRSLQILNGVGTPGIGQAVTAMLRPGGYQVLLTGNADSFDHTTTRIVAYDDDGLEVARDIRERLGVGEVERSGMPQSVVDVTIVVGADLADELPASGDQAPGREADEDGP